MSVTKATVSLKSKFLGCPNFLQQNQQKQRKSDIIDHKETKFIDIVNHLGCHHRKIEAFRQLGALTMLLQDQEQNSLHQFVQTIEIN